MKIKVNGSRLYFDVEGVAYDARGEVAAERPTLILLHGSPGNSDHTVFKRYFHELTDVAQVIYLDMLGSGRSDVCGGISPAGRGLAHHGLPRRRRQDHMSDPGARWRGRSGDTNLR